MVRDFKLAAMGMCLATAALGQPTAVRADAPKALVRADFVFDNAVRQTRNLPTADLRATRRRMLGGGDVRFNALRALADAGDGLAAFRFAKRLQEMDIPDPTGSKAHYYAIAAYTGRDFAVPPLARLLRDEGAGYGASRLTNSLNAMTVQALSGNPVAATLLGQMYADGVPFGRDPEKARIYLGMAADAGNPKAVLQLGVALMSDPADAATGHQGARSALKQAATAEDLSVRVTAENLLRLIDKMPTPKFEVTQ